MNFLIPIISGILYRCGGTDQWKWCPLNQRIWRYLMGVPIAIAGLLTGHGLFSLWAIPAYYIALNIPYGEKSWLNFATEGGKFAICGFMVGLSSIFVLGVFWGILQAILGAISFVVIKALDSADIVKNPWVELLRGSLSCIVYIWR